MFSCRNPIKKLAAEIGQVCDKPKAKKGFGPNYWEVVQNKAIAYLYVLPQKPMFLKQLPKQSQKRG